MEEWTETDIRELLAEKGSAIIYLYTPLCGTCQVAGRMLTVAEEISGSAFAQVDLNYMPDLAFDLKIESVPCLLVIHKGICVEKVYAFRSVPNLLGIIQKYSI